MSALLSFELFERIHMSRDKPDIVVPEEASNRGCILKGELRSSLKGNSDHP
jgi:hypothetical protein